MWSLILLISLVISGAMAKGLNIKEIPDPVLKAASEQLEVVFPEATIEPGEELTPAQARTKPQVSWNADPEKFYVLAMVDPDAPSRDNPILSEIEHWLVVNIKGSDISTGEVLAEYVGPSPPAGSGPHRYMLSVYEEKERQTFDVNDSSATRILFSISEFAEKYDLGAAVAENYFVAQYQNAE